MLTLNVNNGLSELDVGPAKDGNRQGMFQKMECAVGRSCSKIKRKNRMPDGMVFYRYVVSGVLVKISRFGCIDAI